MNEQWMAWCSSSSSSNFAYLSPSLIVSVLEEGVDFRKASGKKSFASYLGS